MTRRVESILESMEHLNNLEKKGSLTNLFYYLDLGIPKFDVFLSNEGKKINKSGKTVSCGRSSIEEINKKLCELMEETKIKEASQASLF